MQTEVTPGDEAGIQRAVEVLRAGGVVAFPTETVYGLGANAGDDAAVQRIFQAKGRPAHNPMIVHVLDLAAAAGLVRVDDRARWLARQFWPGPLTLVLRCRAGAPLAPSVRAGLPTVAVRAPAHAVARRLLAAFNGPIAAPSANRSGSVSPTLAEHVVAQLDGRIPLVLRSGPSEVGLESTVLDLTTDQAVLLRPGAVTRQAIEAVIGPITTSTGDPDRPTAPGQLLRHYAPSVPLRTDAATCGAGEGWLGFAGAPAPPDALLALDLSPAGDLDEAARNLYEMLQALDRAGVSGIAVAPVPDRGVGEAINDRLRRAAASSRR